MFALGTQELGALAVCFGDKRYFLVDRSTTLDAGAFGFVINTGECPIESTAIMTHGFSAF